MPNLPVFRVRPEGGRGGVRTIHRDHILPIEPSVRVPPGPACEEVPVRPRTRAISKRQRQSIRSQREEAPETTDSSSDVEGNRSCRPYREYLERLLKRREVSDGDSESSENEEARELTPDCATEEHETEEEEGPPVTNTAPYDSETDQDGRNNVSAPKEKLSSKTKTHRVLRPRIREKRQIKPVLRLTYDEPGKASEQALTIVHRGIIIKLGEN